MENMIKRVAKVYGISEGEVELEIYRMIGEQIRTGTDVSKNVEDIYMHARHQNHTRVGGEIIRNNDGLRHPYHARQN